jgi:hypothetical protein
LLGWGGSGAWPLLAALRQAAPPAMPSLGDVGYYAGGLLWTSAVWVIAEGVVPDFLSEVEASSYLLSLLTLATLFVLSVAGGADLLEAIKTGGNPVQVAALTFPLLSGFNALMLFRLSRRRQGARLRTGQTAIKLLAAGLGLVYLAQMTLETMTILDARTRGTPAVVRPALLPAIGYALAFGLLVFGVARFPLTTPVVSDHPPDPAKPSPG